MLAFETEETQQYLIYFSSVTLETSLGSDVQDLHIRNKNALQTQRSCIFFVAMSTSFSLMKVHFAFVPSVTFVS